MPYYGTLGFQHQVEKVVRNWAAHYPHGCDEVRKAASRLMELRGDDHGKTRDGYLRGGLPESLNIFMTRAFGVQWIKDPAIRNSFWRVFAIGRFNTFETWRS